MADSQRDIAAGEPISAKWLNDVKNAATKFRRAPNSFHSGNIEINRGGGGGGSSSVTEVVGEMSLTAETVPGIEAVDYEALSAETKAKLDPDGLLELLTAAPQVFKLGINFAHRYAVYRVPPEDPPVEPPAVSEAGYYAVPMLNPAEGEDEPTPMLTLVINMSQSIPTNHLMQMKTVGNPNTAAFDAGPEGGPTTGGGPGGGWGVPSDADPQSQYSNPDSMIAGVIDVVACAPVPTLP